MVPIDEVVQDYWDYYMLNQCAVNRTRHQNIVKLFHSRNLPAEQRTELEYMTGWEFHPDNNRVLRRRRRT